LKNDPSKAEKYFQEQIKSQEGDAQIMRDLARFYLRQRDLDKAELYLRDAYAFQLDDKATALAYACLLCQLSRSQEASVILKRLIADGYEPVRVNMLLSIAYQMDGDSFMADKYKAISNLMQLRSLDRVPIAGTSKENLVPRSSKLATENIKVMNPNSSTPGMDATQTIEDHSNEVESAHAFSNIRLSDQEQDEVLIDLAQYLISENMSEFADSCIGRVEDKQNFNYLGCVAKISIQMGNVGNAVPALEQMIELKNTWLEGYIEIGHAFYKQGGSENALQSYLKAIRVANLTG